jgi:hypothetical protein
VQKIAEDGNYQITSTPGGIAAPGVDPQTLDLLAPLAAMALMSYGGYTLANKLADKRAMREREERIRENMNKLSAQNLEQLALVRKEAAGTDDSGGALIGTMLNPFQGMTPGGGPVYVPSWFNVSGDEQPGQLEKIISKSVLLGGTYGSLAFGMKYLMNALERKKEEEKGTTGIQSAVKAAMPVISPDPYLNDLEEEERKQALGLEAEDAYEAELEKTAGDEGPSWLERKAAEILYGARHPQRTSLTGAAKAVLALAAASTFGAGAILTKQWQDARDENRHRMKAAEEAAKQRALQERPPTLIGDIDPDVKAALDAHITGGRLKVRPRSIELLEGAGAAPPKGTIEAQEMDPTDTLAENIALV